ncbi:MAG: DMT family transporter [Desulfobacteraceae bacterium]|nr:DMT family transporter [Desulfobacteraceae bacterium]
MQPLFSQWLPRACLLLAMLLWASSFVALKIAFRSYDPMVVMFGRMAVASVCLFVAVPRLRGLPYRRSDVPYFAFMVLCEPCLYFLFEAKALENTSASQAGMITAILPLMVAVGARIFLKERITQRTVMGFLLAIAGVCWLTAGARVSSEAPHPILGNIYEFLAMVCATGAMVTLKHVTYRYPPLLVTALQAWVGCLFFFPFLALPSTELPTALDPTATAAVLYLGAFITLGAYGLFNFGASRIPVSQASAFVNLIPVFSVLLGWLILGERFTSVQYMAAALVFTGIAVSQDTGPQGERPGPRPQRMLRLGSR